MEKKFKVAILVGHNSSQQGAYSKDLEMTEWEYNKLVANYLKRKKIVKHMMYILDNHIKVIENKMQEVLDVINKQNYDLVVELHFNSHTTNTAEGSTGIHYKTNSKTKEYLNIFQDMLKRIWGIVKRPLIPITLSDINSVNGAYGILKSKADYVLLEPFFGSNEREARKFKSYLQYGDTLDKSIKNIWRVLNNGI